MKDFPLRADNVSKRFGHRWVLRNISMEIEPGEVAQAHQAGESVPLTNLDESYAVIRRFLLGDG